MSLIKKKAAIITGAAKRLGKAIALTFASYGYDIVVHYHNSHNEAAFLKHVIERLYQKKCLIVRADFNDFYSLKNLVEKAFKVMPYSNVLINNASIFHRKTFLETENEDLTCNYNIHVRAPFFLIQYFAKKCQDKGSIVNVIDHGIIKQSSNYYAYMLTKKSLANLTQMSAFELAPRITVSAICPEFISDDEFLSSSSRDSTLSKVLRKIIDLLDTTGQLYFLCDI
ncbi:SDR family NAD(P)-dependent oxidoreductase [Candidatus Mesenet endosymbiont of Agriotes lineatus]|uniref:SDR family NAD(P)-dependent oxidoreductase n=1 Tax=Candidatus Mesenet endosymbiont of Agriotes lineatus TaxID=3077948 RepID=UPI0030CBA8AC